MITGSKIELEPLDREHLQYLVSSRNAEDSMAGSYQYWHIAASEESRWYEQYLNDPTQRRYIIVHAQLYVGWVGLTHIDYKDQCAELGIRVDAGFRKRGIATEAVSMLTEWAFQEANLHRLYSEVFEGNEASVRLFSKLGWRHWGIKSRAHFQGGRWLDVHCYELLRRWL